MKTTTNNDAGLDLFAIFDSAEFAAECAAITAERAAEAEARRTYPARLASWEAEARRLHSARTHAGGTLRRVRTSRVADDAARARRDRAVARLAAELDAAEAAWATHYATKPVAPQD